MSRVLLIDGRDRLLLFDTQLAYTRVWMAPGGALKVGETYERGARRELWEETGLRDVVLSSCVWMVDFSFAYQGIVYDQRERYFVARVDAHELVIDNWEQAEASEILTHHWWALNEIVASSADFRPANLAVLLPAILRGEYPIAPVMVPVERNAVVF